VTGSGFVHLHNHTEYSMLDGAARIGDLMTASARMGMDALAITDHGTLFGAYEFWKKATTSGIKPIIGVEAYLTPGTSRFDKTRVRWGTGGRADVSGGGAYTHFTMWAENTAGMHNLFRMSSIASIEGYYFKPRIDRELLATYGKGIIATTGCPSGEVQTLLRLGQYERAVASAAELRDIFGPGNYFCASNARCATTCCGWPALSTCRSWRPTICTTSSRATPCRTRPCCACSPARPWTTRGASSSTPTSSTSRARRRCATTGATSRRRATTHCSSPSGATRSSPRA
jgi:hypothetical protein